MEEALEIWTETGEPTGRLAPRSQAHREGLIHLTAHVWILDSRDRILLQLRSWAKETEPGLWDVSSSGHVSGGQSPQEAALREVREELGLELSLGDLELRGRVFREAAYPDRGIWDREFQYLYLCRRPVEDRNFRPDPQEVQALRWMDLAEYLRCLASGDPTLVPRSPAYVDFLSRLESR